MYYAIVNKQTGLVENIAVPPLPGARWEIPETCEVILTNLASPGDSYINGELVKATPLTVPDEPSLEEALE